MTHSRTGGQTLADTSKNQSALIGTKVAEAVEKSLLVATTKHAAKVVYASDYVDVLILVLLTGPFSSEITVAALEHLIADYTCAVFFWGGAGVRDKL